MDESLSSHAEPVKQIMLRREKSEFHKLGSNEKLITISELLIFLSIENKPVTHAGDKDEFLYI